MTTHHLRIFSIGSLIRIAIIAAVFAGGVLMMILMPGRSYEGPLPPLSPADEALREELRRDVERLGGEIGERNVWRCDELVAAAAFIETSLKDAGFQVRSQEYTVEGCACRNLDVELPGARQPGEIVVIGAHYDSVMGSPGANDNGTGVAAVLALARRFAGKAPARTLRFAAFVNEEPPNFMTATMGSMVYAKACRERDEHIVAMLSLETIGYFSDEKRSQVYPPPFSLFYPSTGNFIGFIGNMSNRRLVRRATGTFRKHARFPSEGAAIPGFVPGAGWSDHWSFWQQGYPAIMVTDTAPYRYPYYHCAADTPDKVSYDGVARVVAGLEFVVADLAGLDLP